MKFKVKMRAVKQGIFTNESFDDSYIIEAPSIEKAYDKEKIKAEIEGEKYGVIITILNIEEIKTNSPEKNALAIIDEMLSDEFYRTNYFGNKTLLEVQKRIIETSK